MKGKVYTSVTPFYDTFKKANSFKIRPVLILGESDAGDYVALPISRVTKSVNISTDYDIPVIPSQYPLLNLNALSYIRVHKQTIIHKASIHKMVSDMRNSYPDLYLNVLEKLEQYNKQLMSNALDT